MNVPNMAKADDSPWEFSRANPSPRYRMLMEMYRDLHLNGERQLNLPPEKTFNGMSMPANALRIYQMIQAHKARTILDYGSGKGMQYGNLHLKLDDGTEYPTIAAFWGTERIVCYDPAYPPFSELPRERFDGVITTDVMEHCPEDDLPWILDEIFGFAKLFVYGNIACYPAVKHLPNGENAHCTIQPPEWWQALLQTISVRHPQVRFRFDVDILARGADGKDQHRIASIQG